MRRPLLKVGLALSLTGIMLGIVLTVLGNMLGVWIAVFAGVAAVSDYKAIKREQEREV